MLIVKTSLNDMSERGIGLISQEEIKEGQPVWKFNKIVDVFVDEEDVPTEAKDFFEIYAVEYEKGKLMLNTDNTRFMNHSKNPNIKSNGKQGDLVAVRDIEPGEEMTIDYQSLEEGRPLNFEDKE